MIGKLLQVEFPSLLLDFDESNNPGIDKTKLTSGSSRLLINWKCHKCGFKWRQKVIDRVKRNQKCKACQNSGRLLINLYPDIFKEIDLNKNKDKLVDINGITIGSQRKVWWVCSFGHSWLQSVETRVKLQTKCKVCEIKNKSLAFTNPSLLNEWDYQKNKLIDPTNILPGSNKIVWWKCLKCSHSFQCDIYRRVKGTSCPSCRIKVSHKISFIKKYPLLVKEWDYTKNPISPDNFTEGSNKKVWWKCAKGHSFEMAIYNRTKLNLKCSFCRGLKVDHSNSLFHNRKDLEKEWDYEKNIKSNPKLITIRSNRKVWWKCTNGHSFEATIYNRSKIQGSTCPFCSGHKASENKSLEYTSPDLIKEWNWKRNKIKPSDVLLNSNLKVWWICAIDYKHEWQSKINNRSHGNGCPYCDGKKVLRNQSFAVLRKDLLKEWDFFRNQGLDPFEFSPKSEKKVFWNCTIDSRHIWKTSIAHRNEGTKCPYCSATSIIVRKYLKNRKPILTEQFVLYYLIIYNENEIFYKIGITKNSVEIRFNELFDKTGYKIIKVKIVKGKLEKIVNTEQTTHLKIAKSIDTNLEKYKPKKYFSGYSECYLLPKSLLHYKNKIIERYNENDLFLRLTQIV